MELAEYARFIFALAFVLGLIGALAMLAKKLGWANGQFASQTKLGRLQVVEQLTLDARRSLVLVRRDDVEHLLILGTQGEIVLDRDLSTDILPQNTDNDDQERASAPLIFADFKKKFHGLAANSQPPQGGDAS